jgi:hypothetical protein
MKPGFAFLIVFSLSLAAPFSARAEARAEQASAAVPVCGLIVGKAYKSEVEADPRKSDKYKHCALSCVMTLYCGPADSMSVGILKEIYDALGFGTPDWKDIEADRTGIKVGMKQISNGDYSRDSCYRSCSQLHP